MFADNLYGRDQTIKCSDDNWYRFRSHATHYYYYFFFFNFLLLLLLLLLFYFFYFYFFFFSGVFRALQSGLKQEVLSRDQGWIKTLISPRMKNGTGWNQDTSERSMQEAYPRWREC